LAFIISKSGLKVPVLASDPAEYEDGTIWYNSTTKAFKKVEDGQIATVSGSEWLTEVLTNGASEQLLLQWPKTFRSTVIKFTVERDGEVETGEIVVSNNNSATSITETRNAVITTGLTFSAEISGSDVQLFYSLESKLNNASFKYSITRW
jgi:hypothetical protein